VIVLAKILTIKTRYLVVYNFIGLTYIVALHFLQ